MYTFSTPNTTQNHDFQCETLDEYSHVQVWVSFFLSSFQVNGMDHSHRLCFWETTILVNTQSGWWFGTCFIVPFHIWDVILPIDKHILKRGVGQPPTSDCYPSYPIIIPLLSHYYPY